MRLTTKGRFAVTAMVEGLRRSDPAVTRRFFETYSGRVERTLRRLLGPTSDMEDLVHDVFVDALEAIDKLREPAALPGWVTGIAVITAKRRLQKQYRRRWLSLSPTGVLPEPPSSPGDVEARAAFQSVHEILNLLPHLFIIGPVAAFTFLVAQERLDKIANRGPFGFTQF